MALLRGSFQFLNYDILGIFAIHYLNFRRVTDVMLAALST